MKHFPVLFFLIVSLNSCVYAQQSSGVLTLEDIWTRNTFADEGTDDIRSMNDDECYSTMHYTEQGKLLILKQNYFTGKITDTLFSQEKASVPALITGYEFSPDESQILLTTGHEKIYRHSFKADFYLFDRKTKSVSPLSAGGKQQYPLFSPDGKKVAFVKENNLYIKDLASGKEDQLTSDGKVNAIINGASDWVYSEELDFDRAFEWSPAGDKIAFYRFDESDVREYTMPVYDSLYPSLHRFKYPKAGEQNADVRILVISLPEKEITSIKTGDEKDYYIPRMKWTRNNNLLAILKMNRLQNRVELLIADAESGQCHTVHTEKSETYVEITNDLFFLKDGRHYTWSSEKSGYNHLYLCSLEDSSETALTHGNWDMTQFYGIDEEKGVAYYQSAEESPLQRHIYSVHTDGSGKKKISSAPGTNDAEFSRRFRYFVNTHSDANTPEDIAICRPDGRKIRVVADNASLCKTIKLFHINKKEFFSFKTSGGIMLNGWMIKPPGFDPSNKYPVFFNVYGGPGSQTVTDSWDSRSYLWHQLLAQKGYIVVSVDNRGTGARGTDFKKCTYLRLGEIETADQVEAAKYLSSLSYVDGKRIGIFGWSYGGYLTSLCMTKGAPCFKAGIAVAPVTDWKFYDSIYTERYLRTPKENEEGYEISSVLTYTGKLEGSLLLIHGTGDDNVHFQNSAELVKKLIASGIKFDSFFYPDKDHSIGGANTRLHLYSMMTDFILKNL